MKAYSARWTYCGAAMLALAAAIAATPASAGLKHSYRFNDGTANDSVGTAHGTIVDPLAPTAVYTGGQLDLSANTGQGSGGTGPTEDAYVDLPNGIIEGAANSGTSGALSLEFFFTVSTNRTWQWIGGFAGPNAGGTGEGVTDNGAVSYLFITPNSGRRNQGIEMSNNSGGLGENTFGLSSTGAAPALPNSVQHHVVGVWDKNDTSGGTNPGGTMHLYLNGVEILMGQPNVGTSNAIRPDFNLNDLNDEDNWLGRSQWPDPVFDGLYNEFNIYDHALTGAEVTAKFAAGPVPVPEPMSVAGVAIFMAIALRRRRA